MLQVKIYFLKAKYNSSPAHLTVKWVSQRFSTFEQNWVNKFWNKALVQHSWLSLERPNYISTNKQTKNYKIMSHHLLWRLCGCVFIWISANVNLVDSWCFWGAALWPVLGGCCFVWTAAGGSRPWLFAACELEPFQFINRLPGVLNDLVQVAAFTFSRIRKLLEYWTTWHPWQSISRNKNNSH